MENEKISAEAINDQKLRTEALRYAEKALYEVNRQNDTKIIVSYGELVADTIKEAQRIFEWLKSGKQ